MGFVIMMAVIFAPIGLIWLVLAIAMAIHEPFRKREQHRRHTEWLAQLEAGRKNAGAYASLLRTERVR